MTEFLDHVECQLKFVVLEEFPISLHERSALMLVLSGAVGQRISRPLKQRLGDLPALGKLKV